MLKNLFKKSKSKLIIMVLELVIDFLNDYILKIKLGTELTPFKVEKDDERENPISVSSANVITDLLNKFKK